MAPKGPASLKVLESPLADETSDLPETVREMGVIHLEEIARLTEVIERLADELEAASHPVQSAKDQSRGGAALCGRM